MASRDEWLGALDHPIFFTFVLALVIAGWWAIFRWLFKAAGAPGPAAIFGG